MSEPIFEIRDSAMYEWCALAVYRHPRDPARYVVFTGSGCSCNDFSEPSEAELQAAEPLYRAEVRNRLVRFIEHYNRYIDSGWAIRYLERFETALADES